MSRIRNVDVISTCRHKTYGGAKGFYRCKERLPEASHTFINNTGIIDESMTFLVGIFSSPALASGYLFVLNQGEVLLQCLVRS